MTTTVKLTATQTEVLKAATYRPDGSIEPLPPALRGGARAKVIEGLLSRALIVVDGQNHLITDAGYAAVGRKRKAPAPVAADVKTEPTVAATLATTGQKKQDAFKRLLKVGIEDKTRIRGNTKQAQVLAMLSRPSGATIADICEATGWQAHTVRGTFAGAFKKKLGLAITSTKDSGAARVYRIG